MTQLYLRLFGQPRLEQDDQLVEIKSRKGMAMLAYLATVRKESGRDLLATLLWPEFSQTRARANLRRTLYALNQSPVSHWLQAEGDMLALAPDDGSCVDVRRFNDLVQLGTPDDLARAAALYQADFLEGFFLPDSEPFDEWLTAQQQQYQRQALDMLAQLASWQLEKGASKEAEAYARRQVEIDDLREKAWRQLMTILAQDGRRAEALVEYERCRQLLLDELGVEPAEQTVALAESIRSGTSDIAPRHMNAPEIVTVMRRKKRRPAPDQSSLRSPYRGLFAFREEDAPYFYGREAFSELLSTAVDHRSIVAVVGPSGSGKSSVVHAGVVAGLRETTNWLVASFRPGQRPMQALAASLVMLLDEGMGETERLEETRRLATGLTGGRITLYDVVERIRQKHQSDRLIVVADQFEELFTLVQEAHLRQQFLDVLLELVFMQQYRQAPVFTLLLTLRADFLSQALAYRPLADAIQEADVKLGPMTKVELTRAVTQPAERLGATFEAGLVSRILDEVGHEPGNLPLLEFALTELWEKQSAGQLTHAAYEATGRVEGALAGYADNVFNGLTDAQQAGARRVLVQLVRPGEGTEDTRRLATRAELADDWQRVQLLADARLVVTGRDPAGDDTVEIVHEALIQSWGRLREWLAADRDFRLWQERLRVA
ncbi:MAG: BTAD domain-containing putative transcriptional regulator, partial [Chloroflexota bacterium]